MSNRWERGQSPPYTLSRSTTGGTVITSSSTLAAKDTGFSQLSIAGQFVPYVNAVFHQGNGEEPASGYVTPSGQTLDRASYSVLFSRVSTLWGAGNGSTTFTLPRVNGGVSFQSVTSPSAPKPVGTVSSGNFKNHTHIIQIAANPSGYSAVTPGAGGPTGASQPWPTISHPSTSTAYGTPSPTAQSIDTSAVGVRMVGTAVATALAVSDSFLLPVGTIIGYIGVSTAWSNTNSPWLLCDGTAFERSAYPALYTIIGTTYGSSTSSDFKVPDLRGRFLYHANQYSSQYETITTPSTQLSSSINSNLPQHIHTLNSVVNTSGVNPIVKADMSLYSIGSTDDFMTSYGSGPGNQLVPANASVLWLIKAS